MIYSEWNYGQLKRNHHKCIKILRHTHIHIRTSIHSVHFDINIIMNFHRNWIITTISIPISSTNVYVPACHIEVKMCASIQRSFSSFFSLLFLRYMCVIVVCEYNSISKSSSLKCSIEWFKWKSRSNIVFRYLPKGPKQKKNKEKKNREIYLFWLSNPVCQWNIFDTNRKLHNEVNRNSFSFSFFFASAKAVRLCSIVHIELKRKNE